MILISTSPRSAKALSRSDNRHDILWSLRSLRLYEKRLPAHRDASTLAKVFLFLSNNTVQLMRGSISLTLFPPLSACLSRAHAWAYYRALTRVCRQKWTDFTLLSGVQSKRGLPLFFPLMRLPSQLAMAVLPRWKCLPWTQAWDSRCRNNRGKTLMSCCRKCLRTNLKRTISDREI